MKSIIRSFRIRALLMWALVGGFGVTGLGQVNLEGDQLRIGYWNLRSLLGTRENPDYKRMAQVLHQMDCVALGQVYNDRALAVLVNELTILGGRWNKVKNRRGVGANRSHSERYAILYRSDKMDVAGLPRTTSEPMIQVKGGGRRPFDHQPFVCRFATVDGRMDFSLMVVNITSYLANLRRNGRLQVEPQAFQLGEIQAMKELFLAEQTKSMPEDDLILVGDFRYEPSNAAFSGLLSIPGMKNVIDSTVPTDLVSGRVTDLIFFQAQTLKEYTGDSGVFRFDQTVFKGDVAKAKAACSNHRPVWITVTVPGADQD